MLNMTDLCNIVPTLWPDRNVFIAVVVVVVAEYRN